MTSDWGDPIAHPLFSMIRTQGLMGQRLKSPRGTGVSQKIIDIFFDFI